MKSSEEVFVFSTSFAQDRLWFLDQLVPNTPSYNLPTAVRLTGRLDISVLEESFAEILRRHEILRSTFSTLEEKPVQVVHPSAAFNFHQVDLTGLPKKEREVKTLSLAREETQRPFDLTAGPLMRGTLFKLDSEEHVILLILHHIISDGWSGGVLFREIAALYEAFSKGKPSSLPPLQTQYADFAHWQKEWLQGEVLGKLISYWKKKLQGSPSLLELPTDHPRPTIQTFRGARKSFAVSKALSDSFKNLSQQEGVTLYMTLLAAFQVLLSCYSGQKDICVGSPIANRNRTEIEELIGFFVNTLVLRTDLSGNPTFKELLQRVREVCLGAYAHQEFPFEKLVEEINPVRSLSHSPLFQVMFVLQNDLMKEIKLPGLSFSLLEVESGISNFDLTLEMEETEGKIDGSFEYSTDLFEAATIQKMIHHFISLLETIVDNPNQYLSELPFYIKPALAITSGNFGNDEERARTTLL